jgi:hypothetical protein
MLTQHRHQPGRFDAGHCRARAHQAGLLDHSLAGAAGGGRPAGDRAVGQEGPQLGILALGPSAGILLAASALLNG